MRKNDPIASYFRCFREAMGASVDGELMTAYTDGKQSSLTFSHADYDGLGALLQAGKTQNEKELQLAQQRAEPQPGLFRQFQLMLRYLKLMKRHPAPTLQRPATDWKAKSHSTVFTLTEAQTETFRRRCKERGVTPTSALTWTLHKTLGEMTGKEHELLWSIPVNLRGAYDQPDATANHSVALFVRLNSRDALESLHQAIQSQLREGLHWGSFRMMCCLSWLPSSLYKVLIRQDEKTMERDGKWFAIMSNLGAIKGDERILSRVFVPAGNPSVPLKAISLTWNGRLSLALTVHASLSFHDLHAESLMQAWMRQVLE